jgi:hypothetical protein
MARGALALRASGVHVGQAQIDWLLAGDPAIRWQTLRDLIDAPRALFERERQRTLTEGWGARLLALQDDDGRWGGGLYSPKWTSTTYTLLTLRDIGLPRKCREAARGARLVIDGLLGAEGDPALDERLAALDRCIVGMILAVTVYFGVVDQRTEQIVENLLLEVMPDHGWNCRKHRHPRPHHSSFHTTLNVLEGLQEYRENGQGLSAGKVSKAEAGAIELLLQHGLFRSDKTGKIIHPAFARVVYPYRWHYDFLRALDFMARARVKGDPRAAEAIARLEGYRRADGFWPVGSQYSGRRFFVMERAGPSRWNTLRALRVLRWWHERDGRDSLGKPHA